MTPLGQCFMLDKSLRLTFQSMLAIYKSGFTRVPVYEEDRQVRCVCMSHSRLTKPLIRFSTQMHGLLNLFRTC